MFESLLANYIGQIFKWAVNRFKPRKIDTEKVPKNFFEHVGPGTSQDFVKSSLGPPHRTLNNVWRYKFPDALVQIEFHSDGSASSVALALTNESPKRGFKIPTFDTPLGEIKFDELIQCAQGHLRHRATLRTFELIYEAKFPPSFASNYYTFGALCAQTPGTLAESEFDDQLARSNAESAAKGVRVNWIGISDNQDELWFDWSIALPVSM